MSHSPFLPKQEYSSIGEAANICKLQPYILRYWEKEFTQIEPVRRRNRRYYRAQDIEYILRIKNLLHDQGYSIKGAKDLLEREEKLQGKNSDSTLPFKHELSIRNIADKISLLTEKLEAIKKL